MTVRYDIPPIWARVCLCFFLQRPPGILTGGYMFAGVCVLPRAHLAQLWRGRGGLTKFSRVKDSRVQQCLTIELSGCTGSRSINRCKSCMLRVWVCSKRLELWSWLYTMRRHFLRSLHVYELNRRLVRNSGVNMLWRWLLVIYWL